MRTFAMGERAALADSAIRVEMRIPHGELTAYCLGVGEDRFEVVSARRPASLPCAVALVAGGTGEAEFHVDLAAVDRSIRRLVFVVAADEPGIGAGDMLLSGPDGDIGALDLPVGSLARVRALIVAEVYRRGGWRFGAVAQGYENGLDALVRDIGGDPDTLLTGSHPAPWEPVLADSDVLASTGSPARAAPAGVDTAPTGGVHRKDPDPDPELEADQESSPPDAPTPFAADTRPDGSPGPESEPESESEPRSAEEGMDAGEGAPGTPEADTGEAVPEAGAPAFARRATDGLGSAPAAVADSGTRADSVAGGPRSPSADPFEEWATAGPDTPSRTESDTRPDIGPGPLPAPESGSVSGSATDSPPAPMTATTATGEPVPPGAAETPEAAVAPVEFTPGVGDGPDVVVAEPPGSVVVEPAADASSGDAVPEASPGVIAAEDPGSAVEPAPDTSSDTSPDTARPGAAAPIVHEGRGDKVLVLTRPVESGPFIAEIESDSDGDFVVWTLDDALETGKRLANTVGPHRGRALVDERGGRTTRFKIEASGPWTVRLSPPDLARPLTGRVTGTGAGMLLWPGPRAVVAMSHEGNGAFAVTAFGEDGDEARPVTLAKSAGPYEGESILPAGPCLIGIEADGDWTVEPLDG